MTRGLLIPRESPLYGLWDEIRDYLARSGRGELVESPLGYVVMPEAGDAGFIPDEAETLIGQVLFQRTHADRPANLALGLFTNAAPGETIAYSAITQPSGTGYAEITLTDASWSVTAGVASYAQQTFTGGAGGWTGSIQGYYIATVAGGTRRLVVIEVDANGPYTIQVNDTYRITPSITVA